MLSRPSEKASLQGSWALRGKRLITPAGLREAAVLVRGEKIVAVVAPDESPLAQECCFSPLGVRVSHRESLSVPYCFRPTAL